MSNLDPQIRPDKNGKMVTRHVRTGPQTTSERKTLPSPSVQHDSRYEVLLRTKAALSAIFDGGKSPDDLAINNVEYMAGFEPELLDRVVIQAGANHNLNRLWRHTINGMVASVSFTNLNARKSFERNLVVFPFATDLIPASAHGNNPGLVQDYTRDVRDMTSVLMDDSGEPDSPAMLKSLALISLIRKRYTYRDMEHGWDRELLFSEVAKEAHFIADNIEAVTPVAEEIIKRQSYDIDLIKLIIAAPPALAEGHL